MAKRALLLLVLMNGCGRGDVLGGGSGAGGAAGGVGGGGSQGGRGGGGGTAGCAGTPAFYCIGGCTSDFLMQPSCRDGQWACPAGFVRHDSCKCVGSPLPGYVCGDRGWERVDGGAGGSAGRGGAGGGGGARGGSGGAGGSGGEAGQGGVGGHGDGGPDGATCTGAALTCILGSCRNDIGMLATCNDGVWACPAGTVDLRSCNGCVGNPPPGWVCGDAGWAHLDASSDGGDGQ